MKEKPSTKEQLVYYMLQHISLGTYDNKFLTSLHDNLVSRKNPITTNQADLLTKITLRYFKQFKKQELDANELSLLPWTSQPVLSSPQYTSAFCQVEDDVLTIRSPYNSDFISEIRKMPVIASWDRETKTWSMPYCEITAKHAIECVTKHYSVINFCPVLNEVIDTFSKYETAKYWDPVYVKTTNGYLISGITRQIDEQLNTITMDASPSTIAVLASLGVIISNEVILDACELLSNTLDAHKLIDFASTTSSAILDQDHLPVLVDYLKAVKCDYVLLVDSSKERRKSKITELHTLLIQANINVDLSSRKDSAEFDLSSYTLPIIVNSSLWGMGSFSKMPKCKIVFLGNNKPIDIK